MKKIFLSLFLIICASGFVFAQEEEKKEAPAQDKEEFQTIFSGAKRARFGGWGAPVLKLVNFAPGFNGPFGLTVGGEGGLIVDRSFYIGGAGFGFVTPMDRYHITGAAPGNNIHLGYGGLIVKYHFFPTSVVNFSIGTIIGAGSYGSSAPNSQTSAINNASSPAFVAEPEIYLYLNLAKFCRFGIGGSYRFLVDDGTPKAGLAATNFWGYSVNIMFQFGRF